MTFDGSLDRPLSSSKSRRHTLSLASVPMDHLGGTDYAGAWQAKRGVCHRFIYDEFGKPAE